MKIHVSTASSNRVCIDFEDAKGAAHIIFDELSHLEHFIDTLRHVQKTNCWTEINNCGRLLGVVPERTK